MFDKKQGYGTIISSLVVDAPQGGLRSNPAGHGLKYAYFVVNNKKRGLTLFLFCIFIFIFMFSYFCKELFQSYEFYVFFDIF